MRLPVTVLLLIAVPFFAGCTDRPDIEEQTVQRVFTLESGGSMEYKLFMEEGDTIEYEWTATERIYQDFHGDRGDGSDFFRTHKKGNAGSDAGTFEAPFKGNHGWYWSDDDAGDATITLRVTGRFGEVGVL